MSSTGSQTGGDTELQTVGHTGKGASPQTQQERKSRYNCIALGQDWAKGR